MLVGEQPGDQEDKQGHPFVGPAGGVLWRCLDDAGIDRDTVFVTNAVKHFKHEDRGKRRLHKKPSTAEVEACHPWLDAELRVVRARVIVALGATAARSLFGRTMPIAASRGQTFEVSGRPAIVTYHPSAVLRADEAAAEIRAALVEDLRRADHPGRRRRGGGRLTCDWRSLHDALLRDDEPTVQFASQCQLVGLLDDSDRTCCTARRNAPVPRSGPGPGVYCNSPSSSDVLRQYRV